MGFARSVVGYVLASCIAHASMYIPTYCSHGYASMSHIHIYHNVYTTRIWLTSYQTICLGDVIPGMFASDVDTYIQSNNQRHVYLARTIVTLFNVFTTRVSDLWPFPNWIVTPYNMYTTGASDLWPLPTSSILAIQCVDSTHNATLNTIQQCGSYLTGSSPIACYVLWYTHAHWSHGCHDAPHLFHR